MGRESGGRELCAIIYSQRNASLYTCAMTWENWLALMSAWSFAENDATYQKLIALHQDKSRYYHSDKHIRACLSHLYDMKDQVKDWKMLALSFWFHDAVYRPFSSTNERDSADWAMQFLRDNGAEPEQISRIEDFIMATCHNAEASDSDMQFLIDIDLSILGAAPHIYDQYEKNIRKEYRLVPGFIFRKKRKALLQSFLEKPRIYGSEYFYDLLEEQARENLSRAIKAL